MRIPTQRAVATALLWSLPIVVLIVPQGAQEDRSWIIESVVMLVIALAAAFVFIRWFILQPNLVLLRKVANPWLFLTLLYFAVLNPVWSLSLGNAAGSVIMTALPFSLLGVYYLFAAHRLNADDSRTLLGTLTASGYLMALVVMIVFFTGDMAEYGGRSAQIEGERNLALPIIPMAAVIGVSYALTARGRWRLLGHAALTVIMILAISMTITRAMLVSYVAGAAAVLVVLAWRLPGGLRRGVVQRAIAGIILCVLASLPFIPQWVERFSMVNAGDAITIVGRLDEYAAFSRAFVSSPVLGKGMGHVIVDPTAISYSLRDDGITKCHSHLFFLAGTTGVVGMLLYYGLLGICLLKLWRNSRQERQDLKSMGVIAGAIGCVVAGILYTFTSTTYTALSYNLSLGIVIYLAWAYRPASEGGLHAAR